MFCAIVKNGIENKAANNMLILFIRCHFEAKIHIFLFMKELVFFIPLQF